MHVYVFILPLFSFYENCYSKHIYVINLVLLVVLYTLPEGTSAILSTYVRYFKLNMRSCVNMRSVYFLMIQQLFGGISVYTFDIGYFRFNLHFMNINLHIGVLGIYIHICVQDRRQENEQYSEKEKERGNERMEEEEEDDKEEIFQPPSLPPPLPPLTPPPEALDAQC